MLFDVRKVEILDGSGKNIGEAAGHAAIRVILKDFVDNGAGKVLILSSGNLGERIALGINHAGDAMQIEVPPAG